MTTLFPLLWVACAARGPTPAVARPEPPHAAPLTVAVLGPRPADASLVADLVDEGVAWVLRTGTPTDEGAPLAGIPVLDLATDARTAEGLRRWGTLDIVTSEGALRWAWLDPARPLEQGFWLPGVGRGPLAGAIVLEATGDPVLFEAARDALPVDALALRIDGHDAAPSMRWPEGPWGVAQLSTGGRAPSVLPTEALEPGFRDALIRSFVRDVPAAGPMLDAGAPFAPPAFRVEGWWRVQVEADGSLDVGFRRREGDGRWHTVYQARWARAAGWATY